MEEEKNIFFEEPKGGEGVRIELTRAASGVSSASRVKMKKEEDNELEPEGQLTIDVYQSGNEIVVESAVAGVEPDDLDINVTNDSITIRGKRRRIKEVKDEDYFYQECYWGRFSRSVILPQEVDPEEAYVEFKNGILAVHLPKLNRKKAKKLKVRMG